MQWDVFLSHASEDKSFVRRLARELMNSGLSVWYDDFALDVGDSLRRSIDSGLRNSRYGIVVLSRNFFKKEWPQRELDGLVAREDGISKVLLPVWYKISAEEVRVFAPSLADKLSVFHSGSVKDTASKLLRSIRRDQIRETGWKPQNVELGNSISGVVLPARPCRDRVLCLGKFPVTNALYKNFVTDLGHREPTGKSLAGCGWRGPFRPWENPAYSGSNQPVVCVSFWDAIQFCNWACSMQASIFLPSAEIWDYAATSMRTSVGIHDALGATDDCALHHKSSAPAEIAFGGGRDNPLGVSDMFGNVWEWCEANRYSRYDDVPPLLTRGGPGGMEAELRGGGFLDDLRVVRPALRGGALEHGKDTTHSDLGFRVCGSVNVNRLRADIAAILETMPNLPESVWDLALAPERQYEEAMWRKKF